MEPQEETITISDESSPEARRAVGVRTTRSPLHSIVFDLTSPIALTARSHCATAAKPAKIPQSAGKFGQRGSLSTPGGRKHGRHPLPGSSLKVLYDQPQPQLISKRSCKRFRAAPGPVTDVMSSEEAPALPAETSQVAAGHTVAQGLTTTLAKFAEETGVSAVVVTTSSVKSAWYNRSSENPDRQEAKAVADALYNGDPLPTTTLKIPHERLLRAALEHGDCWVEQNVDKVKALPKKAKLSDVQGSSTQLQPLQPLSEANISVPKMLTNGRAALPEYRPGMQGRLAKHYKYKGGVY